MKKIILLLLIPLFLCGCQTEQEINNLAIVNAIGIDKTRDGNFHVTVQILNTEKNGESEQQNMNKPTLFTAIGYNITEALSNASLKSPKSFYLGHLELVILNENLAKDDITQMTDYFLRNVSVSKNFTMLVSKDQQTLSAINTLNNNTSFPNGNILGSVEIASIVNGSSTNVTFIDFLKDLTMDGKEVILPSIKSTGEEEQKIMIDSIAIFKGNQLVGYLNETENIGYNFITNHIRNTNMNYECGNNQFIGVNITSSKTNLKSKIENNKPVIYIDIASNAEITEVNCANDFDDLAHVRKRTEEEIKDYVVKVIKKTKEDYNSDIFGFGKSIYQNYNSYWNKIKESWHIDGYQQVDVKINVNVVLNNQGSILETIR